MFTVLILEDDTEQQKAITKILEEHYNEWILYTAATYKEACNLIETKNFDLFLLDIELNTAYIDDLDCDGLDFGKYIRSSKIYICTYCISYCSSWQNIFRPSGTSLQFISCKTIHSVQTDWNTWLYYRWTDRKRKRKNHFKGQ